jgi:hypothetical protein
LIDDVGRQHGSIRIGPAGCYVRMADQAQAAALLAHPAASGLGLRAVAPGVLVAAVEEQEIVPLLQELGHSPAVENSAGELIVTPPARRAPRQLAESTAALSPSRHRVAVQRSGASADRAGVVNRPRTLARSLE